MADEVSKSGVFIDTKSGKVVESQPEEGIQLVAPGSVVTPDAERQINAARATEVTEGTVDASAQDSGQDSAAPARVPPPASTVKRR